MPHYCGVGAFRVGFGEVRGGASGGGHGSAMPLQVGLAILVVELIAFGVKPGNGSETARFGTCEKAKGELVAMRMKHSRA